MFTIFRLLFCFCVAENLIFKGLPNEFPASISLNCAAFPSRVIIKTNDPRLVAS